MSAVGWFLVIYVVGLPLAAAIAMTIGHEEDAFEVAMLWPFYAPVLALLVVLNEFSAWRSR